MTKISDNDLLCKHSGPAAETCGQPLGHAGVHAQYLIERDFIDPDGCATTDYSVSEWNDNGARAPEDFGCGVAGINLHDARQAIDCVLIPDAKKTLMRAFGSSADKVIEIRGRIDRKEKGNMNGICWMYRPNPEDVPKGFERYAGQQTPLFDFTGTPQEIKAFGYFLLARIKL